MRGNQLGSASVSGLPSVSAARMAVTGRQKLYVYLASQQAMAVSAKLRSSRANIRALSTRLLPCAVAACWAILFHRPIGVLVGVAIPCQNRADSVWSAVRLVLSMEP